VTRSQILFYQSENGTSRIEVRLDEGTVWLTQALIAELYQTTIPNINIHIGNIFKENELDRNSVVKEYLTTAADGKNYRTLYYNLDMILAIGYRVRSHRGTLAGFKAGIAAVLANAANSTAHAGSASRNAEADSYTVTLRCHDPNGELYNVNFSRQQVTITSYSDEAIRTKVDLWADGITSLA